jgi:hypothetical protein
VVVYSCLSPLPPHSCFRPWGLGWGYSLRGQGSRLGWLIQLHLLLLEKEQVQQELGQVVVG